MTTVTLVQVYISLVALILFLLRDVYLIHSQYTLEYPRAVVSGLNYFLIHINDLPNATWLTNTLTFADDSKLLHTISDPCCSTQLQQDLDALALWCSTWKLSLNTNKCATMQFSLSLPVLVLSTSSTMSSIMCWTTYEPWNPTKQQQLRSICWWTWSKHINFICSSAYQSLHLICHSISFHSPKVRKQLYISLVRSRLTYSWQVWKSHLIKDITCLEKSSSEQLSSIFLVTSL